MPEMIQPSWFFCLPSSSSPLPDSHLPQVCLFLNFCATNLFCWFVISHIIIAYVCLLLFCLCVCFVLVLIVTSVGLLLAIGLFVCLYVFFFSLFVCRFVLTVISVGFSFSFGSFFLQIVSQLLIFRHSTISGIHFWGFVKFLLYVIFVDMVKKILHYHPIVHFIIHISV